MGVKSPPKFINVTHHRSIIPKLVCTRADRVTFNAITAQMEAEELATENDEAAASAATHDDKPKQRRGSLDVTWTTTSKDTLPPFSIKKDSSDSLQHDHPPEIVAHAINKHLSTREDIALVDATPALMMPGYSGLAVALAGLSAEVLALLDARRREVTNADEEALRINLDVSGAANQDGTHHQLAVGVGRVPFIFMVTSVEPIHTDF